MVDFSSLPEVDAPSDLQPVKPVAQTNHADLPEVDAPSDLRPIDAKAAAPNNNSILKGVKPAEDIAPSDGQMMIPGSVDEFGRQLSGPVETHEKGYEDYPEFVSFSPSKIPNATAKQSAALGIGYGFATNDEARTNIIKDNVPGVQFTNDKYGNPLAVYGGEAYHINKPGTFTEGNFVSGASKAVAALPLIAAGAADFPLLGAAALQGVAGTGTSLATQGATSLSGSGQDVSIPQALTEGAIAGALPIAGEGVGQIAKTGVDAAMDGIRPAFSNLGNRLKSGAYDNSPEFLKQWVNPEKAASKTADAAIAKNQAVRNNLTPEQAASSKSTGMTPEDIQAAQSAKQPIMVGDAGGVSLDREARAAANSSSEAQAILRAGLDPRVADQSQRFGDFVKDRFGGIDLNAQNSIDLIEQQAKANRGPLYKQAYQEGQSVWSPRLAELLQSPSVQSVIPRAMNMANDEAAIAGERAIPSPFQQDSNGVYQIKTNPDGSTATPNLRFWDQVKQSLDDKTSALYKSNEPGYASYPKNLSQNLRAELDSIVPTYAKARYEAQLGFQSDNAFDMGRKLYKASNNLDAANINKVIKGSSVDGTPPLPPDQHELLAQGMASEMLHSAKETGFNKDIANKFNSPAKREKIEVALNTPSNPNRAAEIEAYLRRENMMAAKRDVLGGPDTAPKLADLVRKGASNIAPNFGSGAVQGAGASIWAGERDPEEILKYGLMGGLAGFFHKYASGASDKYYQALAKKFVSPIESESSSAMKEIAKRPMLMDALRKYEGTVSASTNAYLNSNQGADDRTSRKSGGVVKMDHEMSADRLIRMAEKAKKKQAEKTKPILNVNDNVVAKALAIANSKI